MYVTGIQACYFLQLTLDLIPLAWGQTPNSSNGQQKLNVSLHLLLPLAVAINDYLSKLEHEQVFSLRNNTDLLA